MFRSRASIIGAAFLLLGACDQADPEAASTPPPSAGDKPAASATPPVPVIPTVERQMLILTGGTQTAQVEQWMAKNRDALADLYPKAGPLPVIQSDDIEGLKPGFFILVPAVCSQEAAASAFYAALHEIPGSYVRTVQVPEQLVPCRTAKTVEWWGLDLSPYNSECLVSSWDLLEEVPEPEPEEPLPSEYDDPNVIPPTPLDQQYIPQLSHRCPEWWSVGPLANATVRVYLHENQSLKGATSAYDMNVGYDDIDAKLVEPGAGIDLASIDGTKLTNNLGFSDASLRGAPVNSKLSALFTQTAGAAPDTSWTFVEMSGVGQGDLAVSTHQHNGTKLTGHVVSYDGKTARRLDQNRGRLLNFRDLEHGRVLIHTDEVTGIYQSRTAEALWVSPRNEWPVLIRY